MYLDNVHKYKNAQAASQPYRDSKPSPLLVDLLSKERVGVDLTQGVRNMMATKAASQETERVYAAGAA
jgi:carbamoyl-phosphate synthase small subunit